ncbi:MAG: glycoside hydrolase family 9 protein [Microscillaceae bacterium]|nr:glycoside hydrolase family 9 protein [Microscillaceae bacterium]
MKKKTYFQKLTLFISFLIVSCYSSAQEIKLNQVGFYPSATKIAVVPLGNTDDFEVIDAKTQKSLYQAKLKPAQHWEYSDENVRIANFSEFKKQGTFQVKSGDQISHPFEIRAQIHQTVAKAALKAFYYNRASIDLEAQYAGTWARKAGHPDDEILVHASAASASRPEGFKFSAPKGWYDAGDYNKYIVNSGISTYTLLLLYEQFPEYCQKLSIDIPESNNQTPDILDEARWNLDWMFAMQDPTDGGVYHKLTELSFSGMVMPDQVKAARFAVMKTTAAALDFAAVMAVAHRTYKKFDLPFATKCLEAARKAWDWAEKNPEIYYKQPKDVNTGAYGDNSVKDEFVWAASELCISSGETKYLDRVDLLESEINIPSWNQVSTLGVISLLHHNALSKFSPTYKDSIAKKFIQFTEELLQKTQSSAYQVGITEFVWGSNSTVANIGLLAIQAYQLTKNQAYLTLALHHLDYILGRNATRYSFVTGHGDKTPMHIHHRPSEADGIAEPIPGFLAGGPQPGQQDGCAYPTKLPAKCYVDDVCSYSTNEIAINWNAPLVYLVWALEALMR